MKTTPLPRPTSLTGRSRPCANPRSSPEALLSQASTFNLALQNKTQWAQQAVVQVRSLLRSSLITSDRRPLQDPTEASFLTRDLIPDRPRQGVFSGSRGSRHTRTHIHTHTQAHTTHTRTYIHTYTQAHNTHTHTPTEFTEFNPKFHHFSLVTFLEVAGLHPPSPLLLS